MGTTKYITCPRCDNWVQRDPGEITTCAFCGKDIRIVLPLRAAKTLNEYDEHEDRGYGEGRL